MKLLIIHSRVEIVHGQQGCRGDGISISIPIPHTMGIPYPRQSPVLPHVGTEFLSPYPYPIPWGSHTHGRIQYCHTWGRNFYPHTHTPYHGDPIPTAESSTATRGDGISISIPIPHTMGIPYQRQNPVLPHVGTEFLSPYPYPWGSSLGSPYPRQTSGGSRIFARGVRQLVPLECPKPLHALSPSDR